MKLAVLFSGGKDSCYAFYLASKFEQVSVLVTMRSRQEYSYMFQSAGIDFTSFQAKALGLPQIVFETCGEKEKELSDLKGALVRAKEEFGVEGVVSGAINSVYQASRIQKICNELGLWCFCPLWQKNQREFLQELLDNNFKVMVVGVASYPLDESFLGRVIDERMLEELFEFEDKFGVNPAGEGGELETFVVDCDCFSKRIVPKDLKRVMDSENSGWLVFGNVDLVEK